jgi:hypothetical protein
MSRLEDRLAGLGTMSPAQLRSEWRQLFRASPPAIGPTLLALGIAYRLQEKATGGLPTAHVRELARLSKQAARGSLEPEHGATLKVGSRLVRNWHGEPHQVLIRDDGFVYRDKLYGSLTPIARVITGCNWSGPRFFGLKGMGQGRARG